MGTARGGCDAARRGVGGGGLHWMHRGTSPTNNGVSAIPASEALDQAVYSYETFETAFRPAVPSGSLEDIAMAYGSAECRT